MTKEEIIKLIKENLTIGVIVSNQDKGERVRVEVSLAWNGCPISYDEDSD